MAKSRLKLEKVNVRKPAELAWLHRFIHRHHSTPKRVLPSRADLRNPNYVHFRAVALEPKELRGQVIGTTCYEVRTPYLVETQRTVVAPEFRGQGWGFQLSLELERAIRRAGFRKIRTTIYVDNLRMIAIKLAQGFRIEGFHPDHDAPGLDEYSLGKILR